MPSYSKLAILASAVATAHAGERLVLEENFDSLNKSLWVPEVSATGSGNGEFEKYENNDENVFVKDGKLYLQPTWTDFNDQRKYHYPITSAKITTRTSFKQKYGRFQVSAKLPRGDWIWPAIWMMPAENKYGSWPASGEIDIVESYGNEATCHNQNNQGFGSTLHWGPKWPYDGWQAGHAGYFNQGGSLANDFHVYEVEWTKDYIKTFIDKKLVLNFDTKSRDMFTAGGFPRSVPNPWANAANNAPFDTEYYFIFNVAVGGTNGYFPDGMCGNKPWKNNQSNPPGAFYDGRAKWWPTWNYPATHNSAMQIDWVKVWAFDDDHAVVQESEPSEEKPEFIN